MFHPVTTEAGDMEQYAHAFVASNETRTNMW
jgi:hypothetical protein